MLLASRRQPRPRERREPTTWNRFSGPGARDAAGKCSGGVPNIRPAGGAVVGGPRREGPCGEREGERGQDGGHGNEEAPAQGVRRGGEGQRRRKRERRQGETPIAHEEEERRDEDEEHRKR